MATGPLTLGPKPPEVTRPMRSPVGARISVPSRAGARPSGLMPTRVRLGPFGELVLDALGAGEAALDAAPLLDRPGEAGLDRARGLVDVVAVEAEAGLEPQRVARAEADRLHARPAASSSLARSAASFGGHRDLEAVLAGVARAARCGSRSRRRGRWPPVMKRELRRLAATGAPSTRSAAGPCSASSARSGAGSELHALPAGGSAMCA